MMMMHAGGGISKLLLSLAFGYFVCVVAKKQTGILKSMGYIIGVAILVFAILYALIISGWMPCLLAKTSSCAAMQKICPTMKK